MAMRCLVYDRMTDVRIMRLMKHRGNLIFAHYVCFDKISLFFHLLYCI